MTLLHIKNCSNYFLFSVFFLMLPADYDEKFMEKMGDVLKYGTRSST
jgi:hypothetical protein